MASRRFLFATRYSLFAPIDVRHPPPRPNPQRAAVRDHPVPDRGRADARVRGDGFHQPRTRRAVHGRRLFRRRLRRLDRELRRRPRAGIAGGARLRPPARGRRLPPPLRPRPPRPGAGHLRHHPVPEPGREGGVGRGAAARADPAGAVRLDRADVRPALSSLPPRHHRGRACRRRPALRPRAPHPRRDAGAGRRHERRHGLGARRRHPPPVHGRVRLRRHARGLCRRDGGADPLGGAGHGRQNTDPRLRRHRHRRHRLDPRRLPRRAPHRPRRHARALLPREAVTRLPAEAAETAAAPPARPARWRGYILPLVLFGLFAVAPAFARHGGEGYILALVLRVMILGIAAMSLDLILGYGALISFGHAAFLGIGAYAVGILTSHGVGDAFGQLGAALAASALFALVTGAISLRTKGVYFIMITLAFGQMLYFLATSLASYGGDDGMTLPRKSLVLGTRILGEGHTFYYVVLACLVGAYLLCRAIVASRFGRVLRGTRENPVRMQAIGFNPLAYQLAAYVIAGALCGLAGFLLANQTEFVSPAFMTWQRSGELIVMVILGGLGSLHGAIIGAAAFVILEEVLSRITELWKMIFGPMLVLVALFARGGILGFFRGLRHG